MENNIGKCSIPSEEGPFGLGSVEGIGSAAAPEELVKVEEDNLAARVVARQTREEEVWNNGRGGVVCAAVGFDAGEVVVFELLRRGVDAEAVPEELVVDANAGVFVEGVGVGEGGVQVVELWWIRGMIGE